MTTAQLLTEIKSRLAEVYGARLRGVVLYGSEARGQAGPDSGVADSIAQDIAARCGKGHFIHGPGTEHGGVI